MFETEWEQAKDIPGYEGRYKINELGEVFSKRNSLPVKKLKRVLNKNTGYIRVNLLWVHGNKPHKTFNIHRLLYLSFIGPLTSEEPVDHANGNRLDNRLSNLRKATHSNNRTNSKKRSNNHNLYRGYTKNKNGKCYVMLGKEHYGSYYSEIAAAVAYDLVALSKYGEFVKTNLIKTADMLLKEQSLANLEGR